MPRAGAARRAEFLPTLHYSGDMWRLFREMVGLRNWGAVRLCGCIVVALLAVTVMPAQAARFDPAAWITGATKPTSEADQLAEAVKWINTLDVRPPALVLAASVTAQGHWTFANQTGQRFTAANKKELARVYANLAPDITGRPAPVIVYLTPASVFTHTEHLDPLPPDARLRLLVGKRHYPLHRLGAGSRRTWFAEVRGNVFVRVNDAATFAETTGQLARPLPGGSMRILALEPDAPDTLRPRALLDAEGRPAPDAIKPGKLASALPTLRRQTAIITGRLGDGDTLIYRTPSGLEQVLELPPLRAQAARVDANLVFVNATAPRQPGARNWLWLRVEVDGLARALGGETLGDFLHALSGGSGRLFAETRPIGSDRVALSVVPMRAGSLDREPGLWSSVLAELVSEVAGSVLPHAVDAHLVSMARQRELDRRWLPGVASSVQYGVALAFVFGLFGLPVAWRWWQRLWPPEARAQYADAVGFAAARGMRLLAFLAVFLPVAGLPAALFGLLRVIARLVRPARFNSKADAGAASR